MEQNDVLPEKIRHVIEQLKAMSQKGEINFAFAFAYPDNNHQYWFEAHSGGTVKVLKSLFEDDTNAEAIAKLNLGAEKEDEYVYFSKLRTILTAAE